MLELIQSDQNLVGETVATVLFLGIFAWSVLAMRRGWRRRSGDAATRFGAAPVAQAPAREPDGVALYTGTTVAGSRTERVALPELFGRWTCRWWAEPDAVVLGRAGGQALRLTGISEAGLTGAHAGRAVGRDRIAVVRWRLGEHDVDTGLQFDSAQDAAAFTARLEAAVEGPRNA